MPTSPAPFVPLTTDDARDAAGVLDVALEHVGHRLEGSEGLHAVLKAWIDDTMPADTFEAIELLAAFHRPNYFPQLNANAVDLIRSHCVEILKQCNRALCDARDTNETGLELAFPVRYARIAAIEQAHEDLGNAIALLKLEAAR